MGTPLTQENLTKAQTRGAESGKENEPPKLPSETCVEAASVEGNTQAEPPKPVPGIKFIDRRDPELEHTWLPNRVIEYSIEGLVHAIWGTETNAEFKVEVLKDEPLSWDGTRHEDCYIQIVDVGTGKPEHRTKYCADYKSALRRLYQDLIRIHTGERDWICIWDEELGMDVMEMVDASEDGES